MSEPVPHTVVGLLASSSARVIDCHGTVRTAADILKAGIQLAGRLTAAGIAPGDRVAVQMTNTPCYLDLLAAAAIGRFVIMSVNTRFSDSLAASLIQRSGARLVLRDSAEVAALPERVEVNAAETQPEDRFVIFTTSGTTSDPKLVVHSQRSIAHHAAEVARTFGYTAASTVLIPLPLCGTFALTALFGAVAGNATIVVPEVFDVADVAGLIETHQVTSMHAPDDAFHRLLESGANLGSITTAGYGRFNSSLDGIVERALVHGLRLSGIYGMSEVQALYSFRQPSEPDSTRWLAGGTLTSPTADYRVVDGELQLKGPSLFEGYLRDGGSEVDAALTAANHDDGWFRTGDLAEAEGPRSFRFVTRLGDTMRLGGFLVAPAEIEAAILELAEIVAAQVVAVDLPAGSRPVAFVLMAAGETLDEHRVITHCQATLAKFKSPVRVVALDAFPVTDGPNGVKIQRTQLRSQAKDLLGEQT